MLLWLDVSCGQKTLVDINLVLLHMQTDTSAMLFENTSNASNKEKQLRGSVSALLPQLLDCEKQSN